MTMAPRRLGFLGAAGALLLGAMPDRLWACATCFGKSDSALAVGLNWGIASLLGIVTLVLGGIAAFFVHVAKRTAALEALEPSGSPEAEIPDALAQRETALTPP
jgi:hypothetical protein